MVCFQDKLQELIVDYIKNLSQDERKKNSILSADNTERIVALQNEQKILILVGIPLENPASSLRLEYLPESERHELKEEWLKPVELEDSTFWSQLHKDFLRYVGKARIFAHPDVSEILIASIERDKIEKLIDRALQFILNK